MYTMTEHESSHRFIFYEIKRFSKQNKKNRTKIHKKCAHYFHGLSQSANKLLHWIVKSHHLFTHMYFRRTQFIQIKLHSMRMILTYKRILFFRIDWCFACFIQFSSALKRNVSFRALFNGIYALKLEIRWFQFSFIHSK